MPIFGPRLRSFAVRGTRVTQLVPGGFSSTKGICGCCALIVHAPLRWEAGSWTPSAGKLTSRPQAMRPCCYSAMCVTRAGSPAPFGLVARQGPSACRRYAPFPPRLGWWLAPSPARPPMLLLPIGRRERACLLLGRPCRCYFWASPVCGRLAPLSLLFVMTGTRTRPSPI